MTEPERLGRDELQSLLSKHLKSEREARAAAERAEERQRFLARASLVLDESLDPDVTLARVATLAVEGIADWCSVDMVDLDGSLRHVVTAHSDPARVDLAETLLERYPPDPEGTIGAPNVVRTGRSELYPEVTHERLARTVEDDEHLALMRSVGIGSAMIVPMKTRGRILGAISLVATEAGRRFGEDDLRLAEDLARRAAIAVETSQLYTERATVARTLQQSLLPPQLPEIDGFDIAARYTAAGAGNQVGGDFYDLFEIGPSEWAVVIGDVCGKGAEAASLTALVRYTIRALATSDRDPSEVLEMVNDAILRQRADRRFCTVAVAKLGLAPDGGATVTFANGGHPLPLVLRADGTAASFGNPGTLLGVLPDPDFADETIEIGPGEGLVMYTDGVTEAKAPSVLLEPEDLARVVEKCPPEPAAELARCIEESMFEEDQGPPQDDIAILVLRALATGDPARSRDGAAARFSAD